MASFTASGQNSPEYVLGPGESLTITTTTTGAFTGTIDVIAGRYSGAGAVQASITGAAVTTFTNNAPNEVVVRLYCSVFNEEDNVSYTVSQVSVAEDLAFVGDDVVDGDGAILVTLGPTAATFPGSVTLTSGSLTLTSGNAALTSGNLTLTKGAFTVTSGSATLTSGSFTVTNGAVAVTSGSVTLTSGSFTVTNGAVLISSGSTTLASGSFTMTNGGATLTSGNVTLTKGTITCVDSGEYGFVHTSGLWDDVTFQAGGINPTGPGSAAATVNADQGMLEFDKSSDEYIVGVCQLPHKWKAGTAVEPHLHIYADVATDPVNTTDRIDTDTDGACDGVLADGGYTFTGTGVGTAAAAAGCYVKILDTGAAAKATLGYYLVSAIIGANSVRLTTNPVSGAETGITWAVYANTVCFVFEYAITDVGDTWDQSTYTAVPVTFRLSDFVASKPAHQMLEFGALTMTGFQHSALIHWRVYRDADHATDTYDDDVHLGAVDFHCRVNKLGSLAEHGENA